MKDQQIDEQIRKLVHSEEISLPEGIEKRWRETLRMLPEKKKRRYPLKWLSSVAVLFLLSLSIYAIYQGDLTNLNDNDIAEKTDTLAEAGLHTEGQSRAIGQMLEAKPYHLSEIKKVFPNVIYGFDTAELSEQALKPITYQLLNAVPGEDGIEMVYQVGEFENGFILHQTIVNDEQKENVLSNFTTMTDYKGTPLYQAVVLDELQFYLFSANPETEAISVGEMVIDSQWIQIQSMDYALSEAEFAWLFQKLKEQ